jgi:hypothetical protein
VFSPIYNTSLIRTLVIADTKFVTEMINSTDTTLHRLIKFVLDKANNGADISGCGLLVCGTMWFGRYVSAYWRSLTAKLHGMISYKTTVRIRSARKILNLRRN